MSQIDRDIKNIQKSIDALEEEKKRISERNAFESCISGDAYFDAGFGSEMIMYDRRMQVADRSLEIEEIDRQIAKFRKMLDEKLAEKDAAGKQRAF